jgi:hypothetical protein
MVAPIFAPVSPVGIVKDGFILNKGRRKTLFKIPTDPHHLEENFSWPLSSNIHLKKSLFPLLAENDPVLDYTNWADWSEYWRDHLTALDLWRYTDPNTQTALPDSN